MVRKYGVDITGKSAVEKVALLRQFRQQQYEKLQDAVYMRRGWIQEGILSVETVKRLGIDFPKVTDLLSAHEFE